MKTKHIFLLLLTFIFINNCQNKNNKDNINGCTPEKTSTTLLAKSFNEVTFLATHNSMSNSDNNYKNPNQTLSISRQLNFGIRTFLIDTYDKDNEAVTYHYSDTLGYQKLSDILNEIQNFQNCNPNEIISIIFQNEGTDAVLQKTLVSLNWDTLSFVYKGTWPTLQSMIDSNKKLVLFVEKNNAGRAEYLNPAFSTIFDNSYTYKYLTEFNLRCDLNRGGGGDKSLFLINHWLGDISGFGDIQLAKTANEYNILKKRVNDCTSLQKHRVNFIAVDFVEVGDAKKIVDEQNSL